MTATVAIVNQKGGVGKTTLAVNLAGILARRRRTVLIDADRQRSATLWAETGPPAPFAVLAVDPDIEVDGLQAELCRLDAGAVVIDTPPELASVATAATLLADLILIPSGASPLDLQGTRAAVDLVRAARAQRDALTPRAALVPFRVLNGTVLARELPDALRRLAEPVLSPISQRVAAIEAAVVGKMVAEHAPNSLSAYEFGEVGRYVEEFIWQLQRRDRRRSSPASRSVLSGIAH